MNKSSNQVLADGADYRDGAHIDALIARSRELVELNREIRAVAELHRRNAMPKEYRSPTAGPAIG